MYAALLLFAATATASALPPAPAARTSVGRDLVVSDPVAGNVAAILANVSVDARVAGNVIVWGGNVRFGPNGSVDGNLSVFAGEITAPPGRGLPVAGAVSTPGSLLRLYLEEMHRAPWSEGSRTRAAWGLRLMALSIWLFASLVLLYVFGSPLPRAAAAAAQNWPGSLLLGVLGVLTLFLAAAAALALLPSAFSIPMAIFFAGLAVVAKVFGMAALFLVLGQKLLGNVSPGKRPAALAAGFAALAAGSLVPVFGAILWSAASVAAVGIAFSSRFGTPRMRVALPA